MRKEIDEVATEAIGQETVSSSTWSITGVDPDDGEEWEVAVDR